MEFEFTKVGERGQVVIPQEFRKSMGIIRGEKFMVVGHGDSLILKRMKEPAIEDLDRMLAKGRAHAEKHNLTLKDAEDALRRARAAK